MYFFAQFVFFWVSWLLGLLQISTILSLPRWPSYKLYGSGSAILLEPCPANLHTSIVDVITGAPPSPPSTPTSPNDAAAATNDEDVPETSIQITSYPISTMAVPSAAGCNITAQVSVLCYVPCVSILFLCMNLCWCGGF